MIKFSVLLPRFDSHYHELQGIIPSLLLDGNFMVSDIA